MGTRSSVVFAGEYLFGRQEMTTLGLTETEIFKKSDIAVIQLTEAIQLFTEQKFICSITLAGASEEIFAGLLKASGKKPIIEETFEHYRSVQEITGFNILNGQTKNDVFRKWNHAKNRSKHHNKEEDMHVEFNACDEAYWMIKRAITNAGSLGVEISNENDFDNWVIENACL